MRQPGVRVLTPLRDRDFRLLAGGAFVSLLGDGFFYVAIALQVYAVSNVPTAMSAVGLAWSLSAVVFLLAGGWCSDRFPRRRVMIVADLVRAGAIGGIGLLSISGSLRLGHILALGSLFGVANAFFIPASTSIVPDLVRSADLPQANALMGMARPLATRLLGPALGGLVVEGVGPGAAILIDAGTFVVSAALLTAIRARPAVADASAAIRGRTLRDIADGLAFVRANRWLWAWLLAAACGVLAYYGPVEVLLPFVVRNDLGEGGRAFGLILACGGLGAIIVAATVGQLDLPRRFLSLMYACQALAVGAVAVYGVMTSVWQGMVISFVLSGLFAYADIAWTTTLQRHVPREVLGRVSSLDWFTWMGLVPISFALTGPLVAVFGTRAVLIVAPLLGAAAVAGLAFLPGARQPEQRPRGGFAAPPPAPASGVARDLRLGASERPG